MPLNELRDFPQIGLWAVCVYPDYTVWNKRNFVRFYGPFSSLTHFVWVG